MYYCLFRDHSQSVSVLEILIRICLFQVEYDFKYYKMEMPADIQLLILSEGKSNILPADLVLPFQPSSVGSSGSVSAEALDSWRWYLGTLRSLPHSIDSEMQKVSLQFLIKTGSFFPT